MRNRPAQHKVQVVDAIKETRNYPCVEGQPIQNGKENKQNFLPETRIMRDVDKIMKELRQNIDKNQIISTLPQSYLPTKLRPKSNISPKDPNSRNAPIKLQNFEPCSITKHQIHNNSKAI